jgi:hypothetical protein
MRVAAMTTAEAIVTGVDFVSMPTQELLLHHRYAPRVPER